MVAHNNKTQCYDRQPHTAIIGKGKHESKMADTLMHVLPRMAMTQPEQL